MRTPLMVICVSMLIITIPLISYVSREQRSSSDDTNVPAIINLPEAHAATTVVKPQASHGEWHPPHMTKVWTTDHKGRMFRVIQLPRCEHIETLIAYNPKGETLKQAKAKLGGVAALTGSFHHPRTFALADFLQRDGAVYAAPTTGRSFLAMNHGGKLMISRDYVSVKGKPEMSALALGQRLAPLERDGFSVAFMNKVTDRMAIGLNSNFIFIVQGKSDIWRLAHFMQHKLPVTEAINSDGGHVVRGKAPVHVVFRWKSGNSASKPIAVLHAQEAQGGK